MCAYFADVSKIEKTIFPALGKWSEGYFASKIILFERYSITIAPRTRAIAQISSS